jgi:hypothetical protein
MICWYNLMNTIKKNLMSISENKLNTVKPAHVGTSIKQPPLLKDHIFLVLAQKTSYELNLF